MAEIGPVRATTAAHFLTVWNNTTPVIIQDETGFGNDDGPDEWVRMSIRHVPSRFPTGSQITLGPKSARKFQRDCIVYVQVFVAGDDTERSDILAKQALNIFEGERIGDLVCEGGGIRETARDGRWRQHLVEVPAHYQETR